MLGGNRIVRHRVSDNRRVRQWDSYDSGTIGKLVSGTVKPVA
jgi:hypothetical protein